LHSLFACCLIDCSPSVSLVFFCFPFCVSIVGQWEEDGTLKIIDRRKDLVKLAHGEYIALGALEVSGGGMFFVLGADQR
jgi:hypothetical protein